MMMCNAMTFEGWILSAGHGFRARKIVKSPVFSAQNGNVNKLRIKVNMLLWPEPAISFTNCY